MPATVDFSSQGYGNDSGTVRVFKDAASIAESNLRRAHCDGVYRLIPKMKCRWKPRNGATMCIRPSQGREIRCRIKPGNNDTCWEYSLLGSGTVEIEHVRESLEQVLGPEEVDGDHEQIKPPVKPVETAHDPIEMLAKMTKAIERQRARQTEIAELHAHIARIDKDIEKLNHDKEDVTLDIMALEEDIAGDKEAAAAQQIVQMLSTMTNG